ncbi:S8 family serine peptidase [Micromonospora sp. RTGN7]|uniref:S8 family serine peptidase n=1 Tax=Micromonospora sp. RTGN7 TaxID=3016526 RepID=UPI0029FF4552|nr:S8 family serine peptidase [Micromonospora sp. RTGN7]
MTPYEEDPLHRTGRKSAGLALALGLVLAAPLTTPAGAAPAMPPTAATGAGPASTVGAPTAGSGPAGKAAGRPATVTLVTGDRVTVTAGGVVSVRPGAGRAELRFLVQRDRGHVTVLPQDALPLLRSGKVDRRLFDVTGLIDAGYDDARRDTLPLLVSYRSADARRAVAGITGTRVTRDLPAIGGAALTAEKARAGAVWGAVTTGRASARVDTAEGVDRLWLDGRRQVTLDHSVPQIGAPAAHAAGLTGSGVTVAVLDTGVDPDHPDFAGRLAESRNFSEAPEPGDVIGHGTHVASIIAGSGAASGGKYRGVAPDATLLSGKVCESFGCSDSAILAGMQWAAVEKHATVVNMSLSGMDTPEVDPLEQAVQTLTAQTGTLFVLAAGNSGSDGSVGSPASADAALAVGAVDRDDELADFSSRGPRVGDDALKPDLTAPGVEIVAARAAGSDIGEPVGEKYMSLSGTSMATPHVVGSVALLAQRHPDWRAGALKSTLMASAKPHPGQTAYQQGAGRVDVARAIGQQLTSDPASVSFGRAQWPHGDDPVVGRTVTWHNSGATPVTLDLAVEATGPGGDPAPAGLFRLGASRITVPAGGQAQATVTADTRVDSPDGYYTGRIVARSGATVAVTPIAVHREVESYEVTISHLGQDGRPATEYGTTLVNLDTSEFPTDVYDADGTVTVRVPKGRYGLASYLFATDADGEPTGATLLARPELVVDRALRLTLDARTAKPVLNTVPQRGAVPHLIDVSAIFFGADESSYSFGLWSDAFEGLTVGQVGPASTPDRFVATIGSQWAAQDASASPYLYALLEAFPGRMPTGFVKHYRSRDLATVVHTFRDPYPGLEADRFVMGELEYNTGGSGLVLPIPTPGRRVEHYSTNHVRWETELDFGTRAPEGWLDIEAVLFTRPTAYRAGRTYHETWGVAPLAPSFPARRWPSDGITRAGDTVVVNLPVHSDAAGHPGGSFNDPEWTRLYREGKLVGESEYAGYGEFRVPAGAADYRVETLAKRGLVDLSTEVTSAWTFRSRHVPGDGFAALPAMAVRFTPALRADNSAPAGRSFTVPVRVERQEGAPAAKVSSLTVDASYDGGKTWRKAELRRQGSGWTATVKHPAGAGYVSLRATAKDTAGSTVSTRIIQAYRLR